ncbi:hypothetical protein [Actinoplanes sp. NPDC049265]|uniref:hypothetical protein n=1 Tax=Actinoplanes sp. NPDC049265 TaxID=3363902 RepID=UPI0037248617
MKSFLIVVGFIVIIVVVRMVVSRVLGLAFNPLEAKLRQKLLGTGPAPTTQTTTGGGTTDWTTTTTRPSTTGSIGGAASRTVAPPAGNDVAADPALSGLESFQVVNRAVTALAIHLPEAATASGAARALFDAVAEALRAEDEASLLDDFVRNPQDDSQVKRTLRQHLRSHPETAAELSRLTAAA